MSNSWKPSTLIGVGLAMCLIVGGGWTLVQQHQMAHDAAVTEGTVLNSSLGSEHVNTRPVVFDASGTVPQITYKYTVDGTVYKNDALRPLLSQSYAMIPQQAAAFVRSHREGATVSVYYLPESPEQSFLVRQYAFVPSYIALIGGLLLLGDCSTTGSTLGLLLRLSTKRPPVMNEGSTVPSTSTLNTGISDEEQASFFSRDMLVWIGIVAASELLVVHYYLLSDGPDAVVAPLAAIVLLVVLGVAIHRRWEQRSYYT